VECHRAKKSSRCLLPLHRSCLDVSISTAFMNQSSCTTQFLGLSDPPGIACLPIQEGRTPVQHVAAAPESQSWWRDGVFLITRLNQ
jgi:hypothetical protein